VQADGNGVKPAINIDKNFTGTTNTYGAYGLNIDYDVSGISASGQLLIAAAINIDYDQAASHVGTCTGYGIHATLDGSTSGTQDLIGIFLDVEGVDTHLGLYIDCPAGADDYHVKLVDDSDNGDFFGIQVDTHGATTLITIDDDAAAANLTFDIDGKIAFEAIAGDEAVFNDGGLDVDFRVESVDETHMIFVEGSSNRMSIGDSTDAPGATLELTNASDAGVPLLQLNNNDVDKRALEINAANTTVPAVVVIADSIQNSAAILVSADGLTTGNALSIDDASTNTGTRSTVAIYQSAPAATGAEALYLFSNSNGGTAAINIDRNAAGTVAVDAIRGINIDLDQTGEITSAIGVVVGIETNIETNAAADGTINAWGNRITMTGDTDGTHTHVGLEINLGDADTNTHIKMVAGADNDGSDYATIHCADTGDLTIATIGDGTTDSDITLDADGDIILKPAGGDVLPDGDGTRNFGSGAKRWANVYTSDLHLKNDRGDWTIIEEENDLTIKNNKTNKMYRFKLEEIED